MGALPWTIRSLGITGDKIGSATSPKFEIPGPPFSESSPLPRKDRLHGDDKRSGSLDEHVMQEQQIAITTPIAATRKSSDEEV
jgi:hypothetical protein